MKEQVAVPKEALKQQRAEVVRRVQREKRRKEQVMVTSSVLVAVLFLFVFSVRLSPTFAGYVAKIPGFSPIVEMIEYDKGIEDIVKNDYFEELGIIVTENQLTVTLVGVTADYSGMVLSYEVDAPFDISQLDTRKVEILQGGKPLQAAHTYSWYNEDPTQHIEQVINVTASEPLQYDVRDFELVFYFDDEQQTIVHVPFTLKNPIKEPKVIDLNKEVVVEGQRLVLEKVSISPLRTVLDIVVDEENTMQILSLDELRLVDERGEDWMAIQNGFTGMGHIRDGRYALHLQSNYFREPETLTFIIGQVAALPKGQDYIEVDFVKEKVLYQPALIDWQIDVEGQLVSVSGPIFADGGRQVLWRAIDEKGNDSYPNSSTWTTGEGDRFETSEQYDEVRSLAPVKIEVNYYPNIIGENIEIPILD